VQRRSGGEFQFLINIRVYLFSIWNFWEFAFLGVNIKMVDFGGVGADGEQICPELE